MFLDNPKKQLAKSLVKNAAIQKKASKKKNGPRKPANVSLDTNLDQGLKRLANTKTMHLHPMTNELIDHKEMMEEYKT